MLAHISSCCSVPAHDSILHFLPLTLTPPPHVTLHGPHSLHSSSGNHIYSSVFAIVIYIFIMPSPPLPQHTHTNTQKTLCAVLLFLRTCLVFAPIVEGFGIQQ